VNEKESPKIELVAATISNGLGSEVKTDMPCSIELENLAIRIKTLDGEIDFIAPIKDRGQFLRDLQCASSELFNANRNEAYPPWVECTCSALENSRLTIESFCDSADPFELTLTIDYRDRRLWMSICEKELQKILEVKSEWMSEDTWV
jgi:hypothetical protein